VVDVDPKPTRPRTDRHARRKARALADECAAVGCGRSDLALSLHHVVYGAGLGRDDHPANLLVLCGDGVTGCHGLFHAADPDARRRVGRAVLRRSDTLAYVKDRLGDEQGRDYLARRYLIPYEEVP